MSRTRLSRSMHSSNQSSSSEEEFMLFGKGLGLLGSHSQTNGTAAEQSTSGSFVKSSKSSSLKNAGYSTMIKHSYGLDSEYSESEDENSRQHIQSHRHTESSTLGYLQRIAFIRWLSELHSWLWYSSWSSLYKLVCHLLLFDTWLLSRCSSLNKLKLFCFLLLPLFLPFLFLLGQHLLDSGYCPTNTSLSVMSNLLPFTSNLFASWRHTDVSDSNVVPKTSDTSTSDWSLWSYIFAHTNSKASSYIDASSVDNLPRLGSKDEIQNIVRNIFKEELSGWMTEVTREHEASVQRQIGEFSQQTIDLKTLQQNHLQHLTMELADLKLSIQSNSRESKSEGDKLDREFVQSKLDHLDAQLHGMQEILLSLRNCCRNQTDYMNVAERHLATLLIQIMNGTGRSDGPFAAFGDWMRSRFVNHDELKAHVASMADHISSDVSQQAENIARQSAAALILKSLDEMKSNPSAFGTSDRGNTTETCSSQEEIKTIVREAIYLYDADKTGLVDYALESSGGSVINTRCAETYHTGTAQFRLFGIPFWYTSNSPRTVIQPDVHPGQCWAFKGTHGYLVIELSATIKPTAFSLEHIPKALSPTGSIDSAPREFSVMGLKKETDLEGIFLGRYTYNADSEPLQHFAVEDPNVDSFPIMELRIHSNYGNPDYTCLYRFRVHGTRQ